MILPANLFPRLSLSRAKAFSKISTLAAALFLVAAAPLQTSAQTTRCTVPVCDVPALLQALEAGSSGDRATTLGNLYHQNRGRSDVPSLKNIHQFSALTYALSKRLGDPENVLAWSVYLRETALSGLLRFAPFDHSDTLAWYLETATIPELSQDRQVRLRYETLQRWRVGVAGIVDATMAHEVSSFLQSALTASRGWGDDEYVLREGLVALDLLNVQLSRLYPQYEGVFAVTASCQPRLADCDSVDLASDRLVIMNSISNDGLLTGVSSRRTNPPNFLHNRASIEDQGLRVRSTSDRLSSSQRPSEIQVDLDGDNQDVQAVLLTSRYPGSLHLQGRLLFSPLQFYVDEGLRGQSPVVTGQFTGKLENENARLIVRRKQDGTMIATIFLGSDAERFDFSTGDYVEHRGVLNLVGFGRQFYHPTKMVLAYRQGNNGQYGWTGAWFTITGELRTASFNRTGEIDRP